MLGASQGVRLAAGGCDTALESSLLLHVPGTAGVHHLGYVTDAVMSNNIRLNRIWFSIAMAWRGAGVYARRSRLLPLDMQRRAALLVQFPPASCGADVKRVRGDWRPLRFAPRATGIRLGDACSPACVLALYAALLTAGTGPAVASAAAGREQVAGVWRSTLAIHLRALWACLSREERTQGREIALPVCIILKNSW